MVTKSEKSAWWSSEGGFFGNHYIHGDHSIEGYIPNVIESIDDRTVREVDGVLNLINPAENACFIDVPTGYGRHALELGRRGYKVTGLDINQEHLAEARKRQKQLGIDNVQFLERDMRLIGEDLENSADAVINMFYSFGFFETDADNEQVFKQFSKTIKPGGKMLLHTDVSPEMIDAGHYRLNETRKIEGGKLIIDEFYDEDTRRINGTWTIHTDDNNTTLTPYSVRIYSAEEFTTLALKSGFSHVSIYGSFNADPFTKDSKEMIVVATK